MSFDDVLIQFKTSPRKIRQLDLCVRIDVSGWCHDVIGIVAIASRDIIRIFVVRKSRDCHVVTSCDAIIDHAAATGEYTAITGELLDAAESIMADRSAPVCGTGGALTTLWSCVAELNSRRVRYAAGAPHVTPFVDITLLAA